MLDYSKIKQIYAVLNSIGIRDQKDDLVSDVTSGRTTSIKELTDLEATELISHLRTFIDQPKPRFETKPGNQIRRSIFSMSYTMGIINKQMNNADKIAAIDKFIMDHPKTGECKPILEMTVTELQALHYQFERFMMHKLEKS